MPYHRKPARDEVVPYPETGNVPSYPGETKGHIVKLIPDGDEWSIFTGKDPQSAKGLICFLDDPPNGGAGIRITGHAKTCVFGKEVAELN